MNKLGLGQEMNIAQTLEMVLSPRMIQMLKLLNMTYMDLMEEIERESEENVMLEIERHDRLLEYLKQIGSERIPKKEITHEDLPGIETLADTTQTLEEHLLKQLDLEETGEKERKIAEVLISNIDDRGFIKNYEQVSETIKKELNVTQKKIDSILEMIQGFEPEGVGARDLKECLVIQVHEYNFETPELEGLLIKAIKDHLEDLAEKSFDKISKSLKIPLDGAVKLAEFIKNNLNPDPGSDFAEKVTCIIPSFTIKKEKDSYKVVNLEKTYGPVIKLSSNYEKMLKDPKSDAETVKFLKGKLESAKDFLENIEKRHKTIEEILNVIIESQSRFFESDSSQLAPLMQKDIADKFGLHPSTVSRAISNKYIQTPRGILSLKYLCPRDIRGLTSENIQKLIGDIIKNEDKASPLDDEQIAEKIRAEGITIKRRTVAAYRQKLGIDISSKRMSAKGGSPP